MAGDRLTGVMSGKKSFFLLLSQGEKNEQPYQGLNPEPLDYCSEALPTELSSSHYNINTCLYLIHPESLFNQGQVRDLLSYTFIQTDMVLEPHWPPNVTV